MKNNLLKSTIIGFLFISIVGTLSHFVFEWSGNNAIVGALFAVNESVWEHLKIAIIPAFMWMFIECFTLEDKNNFFTAKFISFITMMVSIVILFYGYKAILQEDILILDILIFYIAIALGQFVSYRIMKSDEFTLVNENVSAVLLVILFFSFVVFTYVTPKTELFKDPVTNTYGIEE